MSKKKTYKDPFADREAKKYEHPIPSRELLLEIIKKKEKPIKFNDLAKELNLHGDQKEALRRRLRAMERDGQLLRTRGGAFRIMADMGLVKGRFEGHRDGFGFVIPESGGKDVFINSREARAVFNDDEVLVRVVGIDQKGKREGIIVEVLAHNTSKVVGRYFLEGKIGVVEPAGKRIKKDILVPESDSGGAKNGQFVMVEIVQQPTKHTQAMGKITEILGDHMAPGMEIDVAMHTYQLPNSWSEKINQELSGISDNVSEEDCAGRKDLRDLPLVTIDGEDAKDFDDAVYCEEVKNGWRLIVAIADVSFYVKPNMALDHEAYARGNSVYFPGRVVPMLPEKLSNGLCSLNPNVDRLCMVADVTVNESGKIVRSQFYPAVMHSHGRLTYTQVGAFLENDEQPFDKQLNEPITRLHDLYKVLRKARKQRGALDLEITETQIVFGDNKKIEKIVPCERNIAHKLIEECMLCANISAAKYIIEKKLPCLFRTHEPPGEDKVEKFRGFLLDVGLTFTRSNEPIPKDYAKIIGEIVGRPDQHIITMVLLRTLSQAVYSPENKGHFGLAYKSYAHFTSPIRRYPDLLLHRAIKSSLDVGEPALDEDQLYDLGVHCSETERRADEATRDAVDWLKCEYMQDKVGQEFEGVISSVTSFGLFIELKEIYVEGLVHITGLEGDYFVYDELRHRLVGERTKISYRLGDPVKIRVNRVDLDQRFIDFGLVSQPKRKKKVRS